ncbi:MAG: hypothetical protein KJ709_08125 [Nanoarchaeota archaeon]|nr:hypothetical protein [Nanoarchaeota archaeon]
MLDIELQNFIIRQLLKHKVTSDMNAAKRIAEQLLKHEDGQSDEDKRFHSMLISALTPKEIMSIGSDDALDRLKNEVKELKEEIAVLKKKVANPQQLKIGETANKEPAMTCGSGESKQAYNEEDVAVDKIFYFGKK